MRRGRDGRATIATVAARAGRSISTVSAALNGGPGVAAATRAEILRVAEELGYEADPRARMLRRHHTGLVGASFAVGQAFQGLVVDGLYRACSGLGHSLVLAASTPHRDVVKGLRGLRSERCEGLVLVDPGVPGSSLVQAVGRTPTVVMCTTTDLTGADEVVSRDDLGVGFLVDHLVRSGRRRIVYVDGAGETAARGRSQAYAAAMARSGLGEQVQVLPGGATEEDGARAAHALLGKGRLPEALMCFNDHCAVGALMELRRHGVRVPQEVAVTGYDGIPVTGASSFSLTTVRQDATLLAEVAISALLARVHPEQSLQVPPTVLREERARGGSTYRVTPDLIVRDTTAPTDHSPRLRA
ncbi:LacI family DNA-binding transcriptional regulator [Actinomyces sp. 2119]|uniref:LacI family DNA-binding transcriptional regulator n=1 Tax=Actinomyces sp. 2119 TaxID=2321393 RepID=UPI002696417A|nr:LacI family DNA-binding transcriptional regulator [Actinomyces sp. 2119]